VGAETRSYSAQGKVFMELGRVGNVRGMKESDFGEIKETYADFAPSFNCLTSRSHQWWTGINEVLHCFKFTTEPGRGTIVHTSKGDIDAYAVYEIGSSGDDVFIEVKEIAYFAADHRHDLLAFLGALYPEARLTFYSPAEDLFLQEIANPRVVHTALAPSFQFRVINPEKAILSLSAPEGLSQRFTFSISDPVFSHGFEFGIEVRGDELVRCKPDQSNRLEMDIQTFARLYSGYLAPADALALGRIKTRGCQPQSLDSVGDLFSPLSPYRSWLEPG
jgi:predicted acetyltransferase